MGSVASAWTVRIPDHGTVTLEIEHRKISALRDTPPHPLDPPFVSPGFTDLQINGFGGINFSAADLTTDDLSRVLPLLWATGCTTFLPTLITNTETALIRSLRTLENARDTVPGWADSVPGYHIEGPFISAGNSRGTHNTRFMRAPDLAFFHNLQAAANGRIQMVTIAPELPGAHAFIRAVRGSGVTVALSHTDGGPADVHQAVAAGATFNTHLGNGCPALLHRHDAPFWAQLASDQLAAGIICDGFHLTDDMIRIIHRVKGRSRCALVTDAMHLAGLPPGRYSVVGVPIELQPQGKIVTVEGHSLAGSTLSMDRAVSHFRRVTNIGWTEAIEAATSVPAQSIRSNKICPQVRVGEPANLVFWRSDAAENLQVVRTMVAGRTVYERPPL